MNNFTNLNNSLRANNAKNENIIDFVLTANWTNMTVAAGGTHIAQFGTRGAPVYTAGSSSPSLAHNLSQFPGAGAAYLAIRRALYADISLPPPPSGSANTQDQNVEYTNNVSIPANSSATIYTVTLNNMSVLNALHFQFTAGQSLTITNIFVFTGNAATYDFFQPSAYTPSQLISETSAFSLIPSLNSPPDGFTAVAAGGAPITVQFSVASTNASPQTVTLYAYGLSPQRTTYVAELDYIAASGAIYPIAFVDSQQPHTIECDMLIPLPSNQPGDGIGQISLQILNASEFAAVAAVAANAILECSIMTLYAE